MSAYRAGSEFVGGEWQRSEPQIITSGTASSWSFLSDAEYNERLEKRKLFLADADRAFPVEGMSGTFDDSTMEVWKTGAEEEESLRFEVAYCTFCGAEQATLKDNDWFDLNVCQPCLGKMFDAFAAHQGGAE